MLLCWVFIVLVFLFQRLFGVFGFFFLLWPLTPLKSVAIFNCFVFILFTLVFDNNLWRTLRTITPTCDGKHTFLSLCVNGIPDDKLLILCFMKKGTWSSIFSDAKASMLYDLELQRTGSTCQSSLDTNPLRPERQVSPLETTQDWHHLSYMESNNIKRPSPFLFWESLT